NLRAELTKTPKIFLCDTGLMQMLWLKRLQREVLGPVFETSVFAELFKLYGTDQVAYWRTADKREIDFIVQRPSTPMALEAKLTFPHAMPPVFKNLLQAGDSDPEAYRVVGLYGEPAGERMIYPWQLGSPDAAQ
ncbi:MAG: DUF4143 domain-containing protein, partial [Anaerolineae bacterium]